MPGLALQKYVNFTRGACMPRVERPSVLSSSLGFCKQRRGLEANGFFFCSSRVNEQTVLANNLLHCARPYTAEMKKADGHTTSNSSAPSLGSFLNHPSFSGMKYMEPFVGNAQTLCLVRDKSAYSASDTNSTLMRGFQGLQRGQQGSVARLAETRLHDTTMSDQRTVAVLANMFRTVRLEAAEEPGVVASHAEAFLRNPTIQATRFRELDYRNLSPEATFVYCDPPLHKKTFDAGEFWRVARRWTHANNIVVVRTSESPDDFVELVHVSQDRRSDLSQSPRLRLILPECRPASQTRRSMPCALRPKLVVHESIAPQLQVVCQSLFRQPRCSLSQLQEKVRQRLSSGT